MASRINLHDILQKNAFHHGVICSYTFDPDFFENYCLDKFESLSQCGKLSIIIDRKTLNEIISAPRDQQPHYANIRYLLHAVSVPRRFHPKLFLFTTSKKGRLIIGSANFTRPGITSNAEMIFSYDFDVEGDTSTLPLFKAVLDFLEKISLKWPCETLQSNLSELKRETPWILTETPVESNYCIAFKTNLEIPLWKQLTNNFDNKIEEIHILSRYFDDTPVILDKISLDLIDNCPIYIYTQNGLTTLTKPWIENNRFKNGSTKVKLCEYHDEKHPQPLHAKAIIAKSINKVVYAFGSANFTTPALLLTSNSGNLETMVFVTYSIDKPINFDELFDPDKSGYWLSDPDKLISASKSNDEGNLNSYGINLLRAELQSNKVIFIIGHDCPILSTAKYCAVFSFTYEIEGAILEQPCQIGCSGQQLIVNISNDLVHLANKGATIVHVKAGDIRSNDVFLINLVDFETGHNIRRSRQFKEAQENISQFINILDRLSGDEAEDELLYFLNYFDIKVMDIIRPSFGHRTNPGLGLEGMRRLGDKNLIFYEKLHEALISFIDRHLNRLWYHVNNGSLKGAPNFIHIYSSICVTIYYQLERAISGVSAITNPLDKRTWFNLRENIGIYALKAREATRIMLNSYLPNLLPRDSKQHLQNNLKNNWEEINPTFQTLLTLRNRMDGLISKGLSVKIDGISKIKAKYHSSFLSDTQWYPFKQEIEDHYKQLQNMVKQL